MIILFMWTEVLIHYEISKTINLELIFSDIEIMERRYAKVSKVARNDKAMAKEAELVKRIIAHLEDGQNGPLP